MSEAKTVKATVNELRQMGMPEWMIERIANHCTQGCSVWKGGCLADTFLCSVDLVDNDKAAAGKEMVFSYSIRFWLTIQKIKHTKVPE